MALDATKVRVAITGSVHVGPMTAPAPPNASTPIPAEYGDVGYIGEDGVTESYDEDTETLKAWQNGQVVRQMITESSATMQFQMIETKKTSLELFHKGSVVQEDGAGGFRLDVRPPGTDPRKFILSVLDGDKVQRIYVPNGEVTERGEVNYVTDEVTGYQVTITCSPAPDAEGRPYVMTKFSTDPVWGQP